MDDSYGTGERETFIASPPMNDNAAAYLTDHLGGSRFAIGLLADMERRHDGKPLGRFAVDLRSRIEAERDAVEALLLRAGRDPGTVKKAVGWISERISALKLRVTSDAALGDFEAIEMIAVGIYGKTSLWRALSAISASTIDGPEFSRLAERSAEQLGEIERWRIRLAEHALKL